MSQPGPNVTTLLRAWRQGDGAALDRLTPLVYGELRRRARRYLRGERVDHTLRPTALVHEVYLRLINVDGVDWQDRTHFFAVAALQMRRILVDHARARQADKREGTRQRIELAEADGQAPPLNVDLVALNEALLLLEQKHPRAAKVVELRYFGGMTEKEGAEALEISVTTLKREWAFARAWLFKQLNA